MAARRRTNIITTDTVAQEANQELDIVDEQVKRSKTRTKKSVPKTNNENQAVTNNELEGGAAKEERYKNIVQEKINNKLYETVPISAFVKKSIVTAVKNTVGIICRKCGSDNVYSESRQLRSGDEAASILYTCLNCGQKWRVG